MIKVPDAASIAAMQVLSGILFRKVGASSGTNFFGVLCMAAEMKQRGRKGSIVSLICDSGECYLDTYHDPQWIADCRMDIPVWRSRIEAFIASGCKAC